ncbi:MAG: hypothetical protein J0G37_00815 [Afipia sp.]|jgi:hypothetical protein|nr:hypothetical protein [Afipia sp.]
MDMQEFSKYGHVSRPSPFRKKQAFWLNGDILHWRDGHSKGHVALSDLASLVVYEKSGGRVCRLTDNEGRHHDISERHWFGWEAGERRRFGASELHSATFTSLVSALRWRMRKPA